MLRFIKNTLLWKQSFDAAFSYGLGAFPKIDIHRLDEKRYHWREKLGPERHVPPGEAAYRAFEEFADEYYKSYRNKSGEDVTFQRLAAGLEQAAPFEDQDGRYRERRSFLSERWQGYLDAYRDGYQHDKAIREAAVREVSSYRFDREELDRGWQGLLAGDIPRSARLVWYSLSIRRTPHEVVSISSLALRDTMFWLIVFRENRLVTETVMGGGPQHYYARNVGPDASSLGKPIARLLSALQL